MENLQDKTEQVYSILDSLFRKVPSLSMGTSGISGHFRLTSLNAIFVQIDQILREGKLSWHDMHFFDAGMGEGYPFYLAAIRGAGKVTGMDTNLAALKVSQQAFPKLIELIPQHTQANLQWCFGDLDDLHDLKGIHIFYSYNLSFPANTTLPTPLSSFHKCICSNHGHVQEKYYHCIEGSF